MTNEEIALHLHRIEAQLGRLTVLVETEIDHVEKTHEELKSELREFRHVLYGNGNDGLRARLVKAENHLSIMKWYMRTALAAIGGLVIQQVIMRIIM